MRNPFKRRQWFVIAFDPGFYTTLEYENDRKVSHDITFQESNFGERRMTYGDNGLRLSMAKSHSSITKAKHKWEQQGVIQLTVSGEVYSDDYVNIIAPQKDRTGTWKHKPITEVGLLMKQLADSPEFQEIRKHQMVADAYGELEAVIAMHENIDTSE